MCGIVGAVSASSVDQALVTAMRDRLSHRGPDAAGLWATEGGRVCLGHRRLSIIDLSPSAHQPLLTTDGGSAIILNGEIYNFRALRAELELEGVRFRTQSDTEVLLQAYRHWGAACLDRISGMFAFAIWDGAQRKLFCARDRAGEKPFYYARIGETFLFASELKSLLLWPGFRRELDHSALADFFTFGFIPDPTTIWEGASKLPPAHAMTVELYDDGPHVTEPTPYWDLEFEPDLDIDDWGPPIRAALEHAAAEMAFADVPMGTFLSGGIDSSSVTAALAHAGNHMHTFTVGFSEADYDERPFARQVADLFKTVHTERTVEAGDVDAVFRDVILWHFDEPFGDYSYLPTYYVCREARRAITVALTGDGGDELFAGYRKYTHLARRERLERRLSRQLTHALASGAGTLLPTSDLRSRVQRYERSADSLLLSMLTTTGQDEVLRSIARGRFAASLGSYEPMERLRPHLARVPVADVGLVNAMRYLDFKFTLGAGILVKVDRASMAVSLETRPLFLNRAVLDLAGRIPPQALATGREPKIVLREALREWLPASVLDRKKMGFAMPLGRWLRDDPDRLLGSPARSSPLSELVDPAYVSSVATAHSLGGEDRTTELHNFAFLEHWLEKWW